MKLYLAAAAAALLIVGSFGPGFAQTPTTPNGGGQPSATTNAQAPKAADFVRMAGSAGMFEVESSKLALQKSSNASVKMFAQRMIDDHTKAGMQLEMLARQLMIAMPTKLEPNDQAALDKVKAATTNFDLTYVQAQLKGHQDAVMLFQSYAQSGDNPMLKAFAQQTLPTLQDHLRMVQDLAKTVTS